MIAGGDEERVSLLCYLLRIYRYRVLTAHSAAAASKAFDGVACVDLLLVVWPLDGARKLLKSSKAVRCPVLVVAYDEAFLAFGPQVDSALFRDHCSSREVLDRVKVMSARKR